MKISLDELQMFVTVVDSSSITAAANELGQTTSGISRALVRLEEKLQTTLLNRTTRRIEITEEGTLLLSHARSILASVEMAEETMALRRQKPAGRLRVNAATPFMLHVIVPMVCGFRQDYPDIELELNTNEEIIDLLEHRTDVAIRIGPLQDSTLHASPLPGGRLRMLASPAYLASNPPLQTTSDLSQHHLLGFTQPDSLNRWPLRDSEGNQVQIKPDIAASSGETLRQLALEGAGIVRLSDFMTHADRASGRLVEVLAAENIATEQSINAVYYQNSQLSARVASFIDYLRRYMETMQG